MGNNPLKERKKILCFFFFFLEEGKKIVNKMVFKHAHFYLTFQKSLCVCIRVCVRVYVCVLTRACVCVRVARREAGVYLTH